jgi:hypothetical protein
VSEIAQQIQPDGIREAHMGDLIEMIALGVEALKADPAPGQRISYDRIRSLATECIFKPTNFAWVSVCNGEVVAALCALQHPQVVYERNQASVVQFYSKKPGEGVKLIREFLRWARSRRSIKLISFVLEQGADPRISRLLGRMGLDVEQPICCEWR